VTFQRLLHPHTVEDFFSGVWERRHLHVSRDENPALRDLFRELMTLDDVDRLLTTTYAAEPRRWDSVRLGRDGIMIPPGEFLSGRDGAYAMVDVDRVLALHRNGASIILNAVHTTLEPVAELCRAISQSTGSGVHANVYLTPREAQGFPLHFDPHDVFLLQVAGEKHWQLCPSSVPLATIEPREGGQLTPQGPESRIRLRSGELLYIPRGVLHQGVTSDDMSVHLTIGVNPYPWSQLLHDLLTELEQEDVEFRRSVPIRPPRPGDPTDHFEEALSTLTARLMDNGRARRIAERTTDRVHRQRRSPLRGQLTRIHQPDRIGLATPLRLREHSRPEIRRNGTQVVVSFGSTVLTLPAYTESHLDTLCSGDPIRGADLPQTLDDEGKLVLLRRLVREGLLVPAGRDR
jgi:ribosomal protein L16 Arg81 hydroxylase